MNPHDPMAMAIFGSPAGRIKSSMRRVSFFRQKRKDGGIRTGVDVGQDTVLSRFNAGAEESDPTLIWYVDVRAEGPTLPQTGEEAREWFVSQKEVVQQALVSFADELSTGLDVSDAPVKRVVSLGTGNGRKTTLSVVVSAVRRSEAIKLSKVLTDIARNWEAYVQDLVAV
jgi:hypothetical protein